MEDTAESLIVEAFFFLILFRGNRQIPGLATRGELFLLPVGFLLVSFHSILANIFSRRRAGCWSWVVVTGAGAGPALLTGGGPKPVATSHSVAGGRRLGRTPSVPEATATATTTVRGADRRYFREGHFLVGTPSPQASPANYNLIYIAGSPGPLYLDGRDGGLRRVQRTSLPRR